MSSSISRFGLILVAMGTLGACTKNGINYGRSEKLERPPEVELGAVTPKPAGDRPVTTTDSIERGLNRQVRLDKAPGASVLVIGKPFEETWFIVGVLLNQLKLEVTDRNREEGYYYVKYDPDIDYSKPRGFWDDLKSLFSEDRYAERTYSLNLLETYGETEVTAAIAPSPADTGDKSKDELINKTGMNPVEVKAMTDLGQQNDAAPDGPDKLLQALYQTLHSGLKKQSGAHRSE